VVFRPLLTKGLALSRIQTKEPPKRHKPLQRLHMGTFRIIPFINPSTRLKARLLG